MNYDRVIVELMNRISLLEEQVTALSNRVEAAIPCSIQQKSTSKPTGRDKTKYVFEGKVCLKNRLVLEIVKRYVSEHPQINFDELREVFFDKLQGSFGVVRKKESIEEKRVRYFVKPDDVIKLSDCECVVSNQWGKGNIQNILVLAKSLDYKIEAI